jgi:adenylate cyclase class IV
VPSAPAGSPIQGPGRRDRFVLHRPQDPRVFLYRNARIHLDRVVGLGTFVEIEVGVADTKHHAIALMARLARDVQLAQFSTVGGSYRDLLVRRA